MQTIKAESGHAIKVLKKSALATAMIGALSLTATSGVAQAQEQEESGRLSTFLEEVVVTARKREESLQDAPIAITAVTGDGLEARGLTSIADVGRITPNLNYQNSPSAGGAASVSTVYIRGVGQRDFLGTIDNGVGFYIDDVLISRTIGSTVDLLDVERVEVLRGPQGTLFGRNNVGGAIRLYSKKPSEEAGGYVSATIGTDSKIQLRGTYNAPITDNFLTNFSAMVGEQDGYVERAAGGDLGDDDVKAVRGGFAWTPSDAIEVTFSADYTKEEENGAPFVLLETGNTTASGGFASFYNNVTAGDICGFGVGGITSTNPLCYNNVNYVTGGPNLGTSPTFSNVETFGSRLGVDWNILDKITLKSITAIRELDSNFARDADASPFQIVEFFDEFETDQISQELQLSGNAFDGRLDWITGAYYFKEEGRNLNILNFAIAQFDSENAFETTSKAVFAQGTYSVTDNLDVTLGLRYTDEEKTFDPVQTVGPNNIGIPVGVPILPFGENTRSTTETTPMFNIAYDFNDNLMAYATYSEGFRSGGFVQRIFPPLPIVPEFGPESVESYEIGFKYNSDNNGFSLNGALFTVDYTDIQVRTQNPGFVGFFEANVGDADISGLELEMKWALTDSLFLEASYGYTDAEYTAIRVEAPLIAEISLDSEFDFVPEHTINVSLSKEIFLDGNGSLLARLSGTYTSNYFNDPANNARIQTPSVDIWDASLLWTSSSEKYNLNLGVKNLTDEEYLRAGYNNQSIGTADAIFDRGLQWYLTGKMSF